MSDAADPGPAAGDAPARGPALRAEVLALALPALGSGLVDTAQHWVNQTWVGRLGRDATAGLSVATFGVWGLSASLTLLGVGLGALVGRYVGAGRDRAARWVAMQGMRWAWVVAAIVAIAGFALAPLLFAVAGTGEGASRAGTGYLRIAYVGGAAFTTLVALDAVWRGRGNTRVPLRIALAVLACNAVLDPLLIFGLGPVPGLGIAGAALATVVAKAAGAVVSWRALARRGWISAARPPDDEVRLAPTTPLAPGPLPGLDLSVARRFARIGAPTAAGSLLFVVVYLLLSHVVTRAGGDAAQAGLGAGLKGEQVAYVVGIGFAAAASSLVARRMGAGRPQDASAAAWSAVRLASVGTGAWAVLLFLGREPLARLFLGADEVAVAHAVDYFAIVALCLVPQCWEVVLEGAFGGAGMTIPAMTVSVLLTAARLPLSWWFAIERGGGVRAIWVVIAVTAGARGVCLALWFARGTWKTRTV